MFRFLPISFALAFAAAWPLLAFAGGRRGSPMPAVSFARADDPWLALPGGEGPGKGKRVVLIAGDQEYRSEEALPQLARILAARHGFDCTVLFCIDPADGTINPTVNNIPGLDVLKQADLLVLFTRFLDLPDEQLKAILDYVDSGRAVIG